MKLSAVRNVQCEQNVNNIKTKNNNVAFQGNGFADACVKFWQFIDNGGRALQFTVEDCSETNFPRSLRGALAGHKYTGKINVLGFLQEAIREFLTGPTMCATPVAILAIATKMSGKTANTHDENIRNLAFLTGKTNNDTATFKDNFFKTTTEDMLQKTVGEAYKNSDAQKIFSGIKKFNETTDKKEANKILAELEKTYEAILKREKTSFKNTDFAKVSYSIENGKQGSANFKNYVGYISAWADDFTHKLNKENITEFTQNTIESFKNTWRGKRAFITSSMFFVTAILMSFIPKIYTLVTGKINPNASAIYNEAKKDSKAQSNTNEKEVK